MQIGVQRVAGLDIGQTSTKLVVLERKGKGTKIVKTAVFHNRDEGLVDEAEVVNHIGSWLHEQEVSNIECRIGLPQYMAMTQVSDFPEGVNGQLDDMVRYETQQIAGLTDEVFIHDYMRLKPFDGYKNPILLAVCRDSIIQNKLATLEPAEIPIEALHMEGQALCESYIHNIPPEEEGKLVLLLDVGSENTTMALVMNGQVIHVGSFLFGGDFFSEALASHLEINEHEAERVKRTSHLSLENDDCPLRAKAQTFIMELEAALDVSGTFDPQKSDMRIAAIYLSGGGAQIDGFDSFLEKTYNCTVKALSVPQIEEQVGDNEDARLFNIAYGLALQGLGLKKPHENISLTPEAVEWSSLRRRRAALPYVSTILLFLMCVGYVGLRFWALGIQRERLQAEEAKLKKCEEIATPLESNMEKIKMYRQMLVPFAARGNRNRRFVVAIDELSKAVQEDDWFYLVADRLSYQDLEEPFNETSAGPNEEKEEEKEEIFTILGGPKGTTQDKNRVGVYAGSMKPLEGLIFAGFTKRRSRDGLRNVKKTIEILNKSKVFAKADLWPEIAPYDSRAGKPWMKFRMRPFRIACRFRDVEYDPREMEAK